MFDKFKVKKKRNLIGMIHIWSKCHINNADKKNKSTRNFANIHWNQVLRKDRPPEEGGNWGLEGMGVVFYL